MADSAIVVALIGALTYLGILIRFGILDAFDLPALFQVVIGSVASWLILGFATWFAANRLFQGGGRPQTLVGMQGLAVLPLILEVAGSPLSWLGLVWYFAILVVTTKVATDLDYKLSGVSVLIGFAAAALVRALLGVPFALLSGALV
jgi:hypothetical protein